MPQTFENFFYLHEIHLHSLKSLSTLQLVSKMSSHGTSPLDTKDLPGKLKCLYIPTIHNNAPTAAVPKQT